MVEQLQSFDAENEADVHFLVGQEGEEKELISAHKMILSSSSEVFDAMFRFDAQNAKNGKITNDHKNVVPITDVPAEVFKAMLHFIYSADLSQLNGQNAIAVLYAAKKYNVIGLIRACLDFPIGQLQNVFFAFAETHFLGENHFPFWHFADQCLAYIDQNADALFQSDAFLQIDQSLLCDILSRDHLQISGEFVIWEAALRWADEKCRRNGTQCSAQNRCAMLGPALYKIRFPRFTEANFSTQIVHYCSQIWETVLRWADEKCRQNGTECSAQNPLYKIRFPRITEANFSTQIVHYCSQILETALRWADEKCRQNGTECSAQNRRAMLGPALYKIRFPRITEADFITQIVPSGLLTESEVSSILQWHRSRPKPTCRTVPSAPCRPLQFVAQFPTAKRNYQYRATLWQKIDNFAELARQNAGDSKRSFDSVEISGLKWKLNSCVLIDHLVGEKLMSFRFDIECDTDSKIFFDREVIFETTFRICSQKDEKNDHVKKGFNIFYNDVKHFGTGEVVATKKLLDPDLGWHNAEEDTLTFEFRLIVRE